MSQLEKDLAKSQAVERFTGPIDEIIQKLPKEKKYYKARHMLRQSINEILNAALTEDAS